MKHHTYIDSALGRILLISDGHALTGLYFVGQKYQASPPEGRTNEPCAGPFARVDTQIDEYFAGTRQGFDIPLAPQGSAFQLQVWRRLAAIPFGTTVTYLSLAQSLGVPRSVRAIAAAVGRNPISIVVPCHRVIGSDGSLTGYAGGLDRKRKLLLLEAAGEPLLRQQNARQPGAVEGPANHA